jgi:hypothetical protein
MPRDIPQRSHTPVYGDDFHQTFMRQDQNRYDATGSFQPASSDHYKSYPYGYTEYHRQQVELQRQHETQQHDTSSFSQHFYPAEPTPRSNIDKNALNQRASDLDYTTFLQTRNMTYPPSLQAIKDVLPSTDVRPRQHDETQQHQQTQYPHPFSTQPPSSRSYDSQTGPSQRSERSDAPGYTFEQLKQNLVDRWSETTAANIREHGGLNEQEVQSLRAALRKRYPGKVLTPGYQNFDKAYSSRYKQISNLSDRHLASTKEAYRKYVSFDL